MDFVKWWLEFHRVWLIGALFEKLDHNRVSDETFYSFKLHEKPMVRPAVYSWKCCLDTDTTFPYVGAISELFILSIYYSYIFLDRESIRIK